MSTRQRIFFLIVVIVLAVGGLFLLRNTVNAPVPKEAPIEEESTTAFHELRRIDFATLHPSFRFSGTLLAGDEPSGWEGEYIPALESINIYDPSLNGATTLDQSVIFIRQFFADDFLTLTTVDIFSEEATTVQGHSAVRYDIEKKSFIGDFPGQPAWRSARHRVTDVRFTDQDQSTFYVFAARPDLPEAMITAFLDSLAFHNDATSFVAPLTENTVGVTKKPFGLAVSPTSSPITPERFSGFHTGADFEVESSDTKTPVRAMCGGPLREKQTVDGYGGVLIQDCLLDNRAITVVYGHLSPESITAPKGVYLTPGEPIATLGAAFSEETDGERMHLHLGIHRGQLIDQRGYVDSEPALSAWIDPCTLGNICN
jgi:hypothetical protein